MPLTGRKFTRDKIMVIQGAAGSGKTSIALHRIAYLLYHDRKNLKSSNILDPVSPTASFLIILPIALPNWERKILKKRRR
ncbi:MAG: hypothetical protein ACLUVM_10295 [Blautia faecis]